MKKVFVILLLALTCIGCDFPSDDKKQSDADAHDQRQFQLNMQKLQLQAQQDEIKYRQQVVKTCVDKGYVPVIQNGNIDCKAIR